MAKTKTVFICENCGYESPRWLGRCPSCGAWNSFKEVKIEDRKSWIEHDEHLPSPTPLKDIQNTYKVKIPTNIEELDRVLGGGLTKSSYTLIAGEPGIGKSTLILQMAFNLAKQGTVLYVSGEESKEQIKSRAERIGYIPSNVFVLSALSLEQITKIALENKADFLIIDSIQTIYSEKLEQAPQSVAQLRECGGELLRFTKKTGITTLIIGHITKVGDIAGPKILEHMVDVVLLLEGDKNTGFRILRAQKNRFGPTDEVGLFEMTPKGLVPVSPHTLLELHKHNLPIGSTICPVLEGTRVFLVEIQALLTPTPFSMPIRNVSGYDIKRLQILLAVIENNLSLHLRGMDTFINITGGLKIKDTSTDLAVIGAILSSFRKKQPFSRIGLLGEVGLSGEIRKVKKIEKRLEELKRFGFKGAIVPDIRLDVDGLELYPTKNIREVYEQWF